MAVALVGLGSNQGNREQILDRAVERIADLPGVTGVSASSYHATPAIGVEGDRSEFLNAALRAETTLPPEKLFSQLREIETSLGRRREQRWTARAIDLDLLLYDDWTSRDPELTVPHPGVTFRRFVLEPAVEVAADMRHPLLDLTVGQLLDHLNYAPPWIAFQGDPPDMVAELARATARETGARFLGFDTAADNIAALIATAPTLPNDRELITDFWPEIDRAGVLDAPSPKLVVLAEQRPSLNPSTAMRNRRRAASRLCGPWLSVRLNDRQWALREAAAAIEAMRKTPDRTP